MRDPYSILGVKRSADADEIKAAWRTKAKSNHPDHNLDDPNATDRFTEVGQAYDLLKDPERRKRYDRAADMHQTIMQQREAAERAKSARANAEKVMEELAKAQAARDQANAAAMAAKQKAAKASAAKAEQARSESASADTANAAAGKAQQQSQDKQRESPEETIERIFGGSAEAKERAKEHPAPEAEQASDETIQKDEAGEQHRPPLPLMAVELISSLVSRIRGTAPLPEKAPDLSVDAKVTIAELLALKPVALHLADEREVRVPIDPGATDGQVVRLKGQGLKIPGMKQGDLLVALRIARDERFRVEGYELHSVLPVSLQDAVLGGEARVETPEGPRRIEIPSWSGSDQSIRIEGLGLFDDAGGRGDLVVELRIVLWDKPDAKVTDLMRHMRDGLFL